MKCYNCNTENPDGSIFCYECGANLQSENTVFKKENDPSDFKNTQCSDNNELCSETDDITTSFETFQNEPTTQNEAPRHDSNYYGNTNVLSERPAEVIHPLQNTAANYFSEATKNASTTPYGYESVYPDKSRIRAEAFSISSFVISLVNLCSFSLNIPFAIVGLIFGIIGVKSSKKGFSITGIILSAISLIAFFLIFYIIILVIMQLNVNDYPIEYFGTFVSAASNRINL